MNEGKSWFASKTNWTMIVSLAATLLTAAGVHVLEDPGAQAEAVAGLTAIAGLALRFITSQPIK